LQMYHPNEIIIKKKLYKTETKINNRTAFSNRGKPLPAKPTEKETKRREREVTIMVVYNGGGRVK